MECKKINYYLLITVFFLLFVAILVLIKILFEGINEFEWGSVSDWVSASGTVATFWIAYKAFKKAPEWMAQKHYDIVFKIIENAVFKDLSKVRRLSLHLKTRIVTLAGKCKDDAIIYKVKPTNTREMLEVVEINTDEFHHTAYSIINQLKSIERTDYKITDYTQNLITTLKNAAEEYNSLFNRIFIAEDKIELLFFADEQAIDKFRGELLDIQRDAMKTNITLTEVVSKIFADNKPIKDFITHKDK